MPMPESRNKILVISVSGIGNTILQSPMINCLLNDSHFQVDILFASKALSSIFLNDDRIQNIYHISKSLVDKAKLVLELRKNRYHYSVACFPSNRPGFNLLSFIIGAKKRIIHSYAVGAIQTLSFLSNCKIKTDPALHDVEQNLNLLRAFDIDPSAAERKLSFAMAEEHHGFASAFLEKNHISNKTIVGIHAGSKLIGVYKRWPTSHFAGLINLLNKNGLYCLLFSGPEERVITEEIYTQLNDKNMTFIVEEDNLNNVGALIKKCGVFLNTDSGLGHIAPALGVTTYTIIGPAQASRTAPYGEYGHCLSLNLECSPCLKYPFQATHSRVQCPYKFKCLNDLSVEAVFSEIMTGLNQ